jgi:hypothetical protein
MPASDPNPPTNPAEDTPEEQPRSVTITQRPDGIIYTRFEDLSRRSIEAWMAMVRATDGKLRPPVRLLYDFRDAGAPSRFLLDSIGPFVEGLQIPPATRHAYLFRPGPYSRFATSIVRRMPAKVGVVKVFYEERQARNWLLDEESEGPGG